MLKPVIALILMAIASPVWSRQRSMPISVDGLPVRSDERPKQAVSLRDYPSAPTLLDKMGIERFARGARRPIAGNLELALEKGDGLFNEFGQPRHPTRLLLRIGRRF